MIEVSFINGEAAERTLGNISQQLCYRHFLRDCLDLAPGGHHLAHLAVTEIEDIEDHLFLFLIQQPAFSALRHDQLQLFRRVQAGVALCRRNLEHT